MSVRALPGRTTVDEGFITLSRRYKAWRMVRRRPIDTIGAGVILLVIVLAITADIVAPFNFAAQDFASRLQPMSPAHWFGTDSLGRDVFSRIIFGARTSMMASSAGVLISGTIGGLMGLSSGFIGGKYDLILQRVTDSIHSVPL